MSSMRPLSVGRKWIHAQRGPRRWASMEDVSRLGGPWGNGALRGATKKRLRGEVMLGAEKGKRSFGGLVVEEPFNSMK